MDESWRISIGSIVPRRRSAEEPRPRRRPEPPAVPALDPEDFRDVFGGPPRSVLLRRFSGDLTSAFASAEHRPVSSFYDEVFRPAAGDRAHGLPPACGGEGRRLPEFRIPKPERRGLVRTEVGFYNDIFRSDRGGDRRSRSRSKSTRSKSSSAMSLDDVSPSVRASATAEDAVLSSFSSKLRPITIPSRRRTSSPPSTISVEEESSNRTLCVQPYPPQQQQYSSCVRFMDSKDSKGGSSSSNRSDDQTSSELLQQRSHAGGGFSCCFLPPETMSLEASFRGNHREPVSFCNSDDAESPSSVISSCFHDPSASKVDLEAEKMAMEIEREEEEEAEEGDQTIVSSYVIKIGNRDRAGEEAAAAGVDEAIAWAKEKFWSHQMAMDLDQIHDEEVYYSIEAKDRFGGHGDMVRIQFGED